MRVYDALHSTGTVAMAGAGSGSGIILYMVRINYYLVYDESYEPLRTSVSVSSVGFSLVALHRRQAVDSRCRYTI